MNETTFKLLSLINEGKTINEISNELKLSNKKIYSRLTTLKRQGLEFDKKYYYSGEIIYTPKTKYSVFSHSDANIITSPMEQNFEALVISDLHIGCEYERLDLLNRIYDYCKKEGINIIINCGDIIDGMYGPNKKIHDNINEQIEYMIKNYPFDKNILNFSVLGDHDYDSMQSYGKNLATVIENTRHDIVVLGYGIGKINVKNDNILVSHKSDRFDFKLPDRYNKGFLALKGHSHKMKCRFSNPGTTINIPSLSNMPVDGKNRLPSAVRMNLNFKHGIIFNGEFTQLVFDHNDIYTISELFCELSRFKDISKNEIMFEEERTKNKTLELLPTKTTN